jgi:hypothetical protein
MFCMEVYYVIPFDLSIKKIYSYLPFCSYLGWLKKFHVRIYRKITLNILVSDSQNFDFISRKFGNFETKIYMIGSVTLLFYKQCFQKEGKVNF